MVEHYRGFIADSSRWEGFVHRPGDIVISTPAKCGTTWMQTLVGLLLFDGDLPASLTELSPWVDMRIRTREQLEELVGAQTHRRFLKTHVPRDGLPIDGRVTYLVVGRDPRDAWLSMVDHQRNVDEERALALVGEAPPEREDHGPDPVTEPAAAFAADCLLPAGDAHMSVRPAFVLHHLHTWWEHRRDPGVVLFHYADLLRDLRGELRRLATALGVPADDDLVERIAAKAGLDEMRLAARAHAPDAELGIWKDAGAFFSRGRLGEWRAAFPAEVRDAYRDAVEKLHDDEEFLAWAHLGRGGTGDWRS